MTTGGSASRSPWVFFLLLFALSVPLWLVGGLTKQRLPPPINLSLSALQFVAPLLAALVLVYREGRLGSIRQLLQKVIAYRGVKPAVWYVPIILLLPLIYLLSYAVMRLLRLPLPEPHISFRTIPVLFVLFFVTAACEEAGWSGYATDPAQRRWGALKASLIIGLVSAIWHVVPDLQGQQSPAWIVWHRLNSVAERVLIVWIYNNTGRSVFAATLFHAMDNVSAFSFPNDGSHYNPAVVAPITVITAAVIAFLWGGKTLARNRNVVRP